MRPHGKKLSPVRSVGGDPARGPCDRHGHAGAVGLRCHCRPRNARPLPKSESRVFGIRRRVAVLRRRQIRALPAELSQRSNRARDGRLPEKAIEEYLKSGRFFIASKADDPMLLQEIALVGDGQILFSSDYPHGEGRDNAASEILERSDLSEGQKRKILYDNTVRFCDEP